MLGLILAEMRRLGAEPVPAAELAARRASLTGDFGRDVETTGGVAALIGSYVLSGVGPDEIERYLPRGARGDPGRGAGGRGASCSRPNGATVVIVGEASQFVERLRATGANVTVIPIAELNLDSPTLR